jgi:hypothetical protein
MTAIILKFPHHPIRISYDANVGDWLVVWRGWYWRHDTYAGARADAAKIAAVHGERIIDDAREDVFGGAA